VPDELGSAHRTGAQQPRLRRRIETVQIEIVQLSHAGDPRGKGLTARRVGSATGHRCRTTRAAVGHAP
jgi:hypothetical protein